MSHSRELMQGMRLSAGRGLFSNASVTPCNDHGAKIKGLANFLTGTSGEGVTTHDYPRCTKGLDRLISLISDFGLGRNMAVFSNFSSFLFSICPLISG